MKRNILDANEKTKKIAEWLEINLEDPKKIEYFLKFLEAVSRASAHKNIKELYSLAKKEINEFYDEYFEEEEKENLEAQDKDELRNLIKTQKYIEVATDEVINVKMVMEKLYG